QIFPTGKPTRASPKCAEVHRRNQSTERAQSTTTRPRPYCLERRTAPSLSGSWSVSSSKKEQEATNEPCESGLCLSVAVTRMSGYDAFANNQHASCDGSSSPGA